MKKLISILFVCLAAPVFAGAPEVLSVNASFDGQSWRFDVELTHTDTGWDHYADGWGVYLEDGTELGYRVLAHPHVNEMPFTRSLSGVTIPDWITIVYIRPRDSVHGEGELFAVELP